MPQGSVLGIILFVLYTTPLSNIIANHSLNHQLFADDTQLQKSAPLSEGPTSPKNSMHAHAQTERRQNRSSSLSLFVDLEIYRFPPSLDYSWLSQHPLLWFCQEPWIHSCLETVHEEARHKNLPNCFQLKRISSIRRSLTEDGTKTLVTAYISSHGLTTATVSSGVHLILLSNLSRKFRTFLQDLFSWHLVTTTQHLSWKNCTGFLFQTVLSIKSLVCISVL